MGRRKLAIRPREKKISIPEDLADKIDLLLFSQIEQCVPHGAWSKLVENLLRQHLSSLQGTDK